MMTHSILIVTGKPAWEVSLRDQLKNIYQIINYTQPTGYVAHLADDHAALILVDGDSPDWHFWITTPKTSPVTRRIPILLVANSADVRSTALGIGVNLALTPQELLEELPQLVADYARVLDPAAAVQLDCDCQEPLPPLGLEAVALFNRGEFHAQHDLFEELWRQTQSPVRDLYQGTLQLGLAYYQITRGNYRGSMKMLRRSIRWLAQLPDVCQGIDVQQLREDLLHVRAELEKMKPEDIGIFDRSLLKPVKIIK
jgi:predicted metal-dependent hydrolase